MTSPDATREPPTSIPAPASDGFVVDWQLEVPATPDPSDDDRPAPTGRFPRPAL